MERRRHKRTTLDIKARIIINEIAYDGYISNVSESGVGYLLTSSIRIMKEIAPNEVMEVTFKIPSGKTLSLKCELVWTEKGLFSGRTVTLGLKIIDPPPDYGNWIKKLPVSKAHNNAG